jgi:hypothetical protein
MLKLEDVVTSMILATTGLFASAISGHDSSILAVSVSAEYDTSDEYIVDAVKTSV